MTSAPRIAPFQHAVLETLVDRKGAKDHQKQKQIVDAERFFRSDSR